MTPKARSLSLVVALLGGTVGGCGGDETAPAATTGGGGGEGGSGGDGGSVMDGPGAVLPCPPGELLDGGDCLAPGVPDDGCGSGFTHDGDRGCEPVLPTAPCGPGQLAVPGDTACRPVAECAGGTWGAIVTDGATQHVDGSFQGVSTGSASQPWTTIQAGVDAAAPGATVAVAAGTYPEGVVIGQSVTLWGACPADVAIAGPQGATALTVQDTTGTVVVRDLAITGQAAGIVASGADDLLVERVWVHDTGAAGIRTQAGAGATSLVLQDSLIERATSRGLEVRGGACQVERCVVRDVAHQNAGSDAGVAVHLDGGSRGDLSLRQTVIARSPGVGLLASGSTVHLEDSVVQDTVPKLDGSSGMAVWTRAADLERTDLTIQGSVIETSYVYGVRADDSNVVVERSVIRDILPQQSNLLDGMGLRAYGLDGAFPTRPLGRIEQSLIERVHDVGIQGSGVEFEVTALVVRDVDPRQDELIRGRGINFRYAAGNTDQRSQVTLRGCHVERTHEAGIMVIGSDVDIDSCAVIDTRSRQLDGLLGFGVFYGRNIPVTEEGAAGTLTRSLVQEARGAGVTVVASQLTITDVLVRDTLPQADLDDFGDGIAESATLVIVPGHFPTFVDVTRATVERSARAAMATFAAPMAVRETLFDCNPIDMNGEEDDGEPFTFEDLGGNRCGCDVEGNEWQCQVLSTGLTPPVAL